MNRWLLNRVIRALWPWLVRHALRLAAPAPIDRPEWTSDHQQALLNFLRSDTGKQMLLMLRYSEEGLKSIACDEAQKRIDHARGRAVGYRECTASLIVLSAPQPLKEENTADTSDSGADELRDQLSHN